MIEKAQAIPETIVFMPEPFEKEMLYNWKFLLRQRQQELEKFYGPGASEITASISPLSLVSKYSNCP